MVMGTGTREVADWLGVRLSLDAVPYETEYSLKIECLSSKECRTWAAKSRKGVWRPAATTPDWALFFAGFGGNQAVDAVIDDELAVVFAGVFDEAVGEVGDVHLLFGVRLGEDFAHALVAFGFDDGGAVFHALFNESDDVGLGFQVVALGIVRITGLLALRGIGEVIHGRGDVQQLANESAGIGIGLVVVFVFGKIFGDSDEFAADFVPLRQDDLGLRGHGFGGFFFLRRILWAGGARRGICGGEGGEEGQ